MHSNDYESMHILGSDYDGFVLQIVVRYQLNQSLVPSYQFNEEHAELKFCGANSQSFHFVWLSLLF